MRRRLVLPLLAATAPLLALAPAASPAQAATSLQCPSSYQFLFRKDVGESGYPNILRLRVYYSSRADTFCANGERIGYATGRPGNTRISLSASGHRDEVQSTNRINSERAVYMRADPYGHVRLAWYATYQDVANDERAIGNRLVSRPAGPVAD